MSEVLFYSIARAGGVTLPPGLNDPYSPHYRPLYAPRRPRSSKLLKRLRRFTGHRLVRLGELVLRLGRRWATPLGEAGALPRLTAAK